MRHFPVLLVILSLCLSSSVAEERPRVFVLTDIENEPDDAMSLLRCLTYANHFDIEGLAATTSVHQQNRVAPDRIRRIVEAYGKVRDNLELHETWIRQQFPDLFYIASPGFHSDGAYHHATWSGIAFTLGQLGANYDRVDYFTQSRDSQKQKEFVAALDAALERYEAVDLFLLAHRNSYVEWVQSIDGKRRTKIRLVYNTGCWGAQQSQDWLDAGADIYVGHTGRSESPIFYVYFLRHWLRGMPIDDAVTASNESTRSVLALTGGLMYRGRPLDRAWDATRATISGVKGLSITRGLSP